MRPPLPPEPRLPQRPPPPAPPAPEPLDVGSWKPFSARQRGLLVVLTVAVVVVMWLLLIVQPGRKPSRFAAPAAASCVTGQASGCVGGQLDVQLIPARPAASSSGSQ